MDIEIRKAWPKTHYAGGLDNEHGHRVADESK